jgi:NAD(P)-dependent dehydrogenase (short-subunit alcohol dehydrogenase family)
MSEQPLALITGGVRRVGAGIAIQLAKAGYALALHGHSDAAPEEELVTILNEQGTMWHGFVQDFADDNAANKLLGQISERFDRVPDLIVNNASIFGQDDSTNIDQQALENHLRVNMVVPTLLTTALSRSIAKGHRGAIVHILDQRITNPNRDQLRYPLSKQAVAETVKTLAITCAATLRVNGVAPGLTLTAGEFTQEQLTKITEMMPLDRLPNVPDIAAAVLYLAQAQSVTGQTIYVDGGANLKSFDRDFVHLGN